MRRTLSRSIRTKPLFARLFLLALSISFFVLGIFAHVWYAHSRVLLARAVETQTLVHPAGTLTRSFVAAHSARPRAITLVSSMYTGDYPPQRLQELQLVALRNLQLAAVQRYELVAEGAAAVPTEVANASGGRLHISGAPGGVVTYRALFERANQGPRGSAAVVANADIYFDESLACVGLLKERTALALSRHPSPDCALASGRGDTGWEPTDFCAGYDPVGAASHDAFAVVVPVSDAFLQGLGELRVNEFGAENVVVHLLGKAGYAVLNACASVHAFHEHCDARTRARSARQRAGSVAERRGEFGATRRHAGNVGVEEWAEAGLYGGGGGLDCLAYGLVRRSEKTAAAAAAAPESATASAMGVVGGAVR